ncbi:Bug family tripartite tricarboxylate transporter substrate binding protein [Falsiroseomonas stagni]|uniref:Tripartite-type tricarboxylate transporter, receptor component TctC n=1 Tax=Falsiroseomonas stagni DSM 19981 TaxID=1123062 RepID=A0A1I3ZNB5_9PROT|nr:tripartite tricarboxylate transporter substrate-binding protein [Falsiroseomonas stagni]SFK45171.1 Tripartite-type tricarboxylate transporter, receptor component TctC [Falsiroseomonas stagni DSM 19981]
MSVSISRRLALSALATPALAPAFIATGARAQAVSRPARVLVGFAAGGPTDLVARIYAERLRGAYAPSALVDNRPGASGRLAVDATRAADPDGTTLLVTPASVMTLQPHIFPREVRYDALTDFVPVCTLCDFAFAVAVPASHPARTLADLTTWLRAQPAEVPYGSPGAGSGPHFVGDMIGRAVGARLTHVPYRGAAPAVQDALAARIPLVVAVVSDLLPHHGQGVRILAISSRERLPRLPDVPTLAEAGYPALTISEWMGLFAPARTPAPVIAALHQAIQAAVRTEEVRQVLDRLEFQPTVQGPEEFAARIRHDRDLWGPVVRASGFQPET